MIGSSHVSKTSSGIFGNIDLAFCIGVILNIRHQREPDLSALRCMPWLDDLFSNVL